MKELTTEAQRAQRKKSPRRNTDLHGKYSNRHHEEHEAHEVADAASCKICLTADTRRRAQTSSAFHSLRGYLISDYIGVSVFVCVGLWLMRTYGGKVLLRFFCPRARSVDSLFLPESLSFPQNAQRLIGTLDAHGCEQCIDQAGSSCE
jgi:hypothetical protein